MSEWATFLGHHFTTSKDELKFVCSSASVFKIALDVMFYKKKMNLDYWCLWNTNSLFAGATEN